MIWSGRPVGWAIGGQILIKIMYIYHKSTEIQYQYMLCRNVLHLCPHVPSKSAWWWWVDLDISSEYISWFPSPPPIEGSAGCGAEAGANRAGNKPWQSLKFSQYPCWKQLQPVSYLRTYHNRWAALRHYDNQPSRRLQSNYDYDLLTVSPLAQTDIYFVTFDTCDPT